MGVRRLHAQGHGQQSSCGRIHGRRLAGGVGRIYRFVQYRGALRADCGSVGSRQLFVRRLVSVRRRRIYESGFGSDLHIHRCCRECHSRGALDGRRQERDFLQELFRFRYDSCRNDRFPLRRFLHRHSRSQDGLYVYRLVFGLRLHRVRVRAGNAYPFARARGQSARHRERRSIRHVRDFQIEFGSFFHVTSSVWYPRDPHRRVRTRFRSSSRCPPAG